MRFRRLAPLVALAALPLTGCLRSGVDYTRHDQTVVWSWPASQELAQVYRSCGGSAAGATPAQMACTRLGFAGWAQAHGWFAADGAGQHSTVGDDFLDAWPDRYTLAIADVAMDPGSCLVQQIGGTWSHMSPCQVSAD